MSAHFLLWTRKSRVFSRVVGLLSLLFLGIIFVSNVVTPQALAQQPTATPSATKAPTIQNATAVPISISVTVDSTSNNKIKGTVNVENGFLDTIPNLYYQVTLYPRQTEATISGMVAYSLSKPENTIKSKTTEKIPFEIDYSSNIPTGSYEVQAFVGTANKPVMANDSTTISLQGNDTYLEIIPNSCTVTSDAQSFQPGIAPPFDPKQTPTAHCSVVNTQNKDVTAKVTSEYAVRFIDGNPHAQITTAKNSQSFSFKPNEQKVVEFLLPALETPQVYQAFLTLVDTNNQPLSTIIPFRWTVRGPSGYISTVKTNKSYFKKGDTAQVFATVASSMDLFWRGELENEGTDVQQPILKTTIYDQTGAICAQQEKPLPKLPKNEVVWPVQTASMEITQECMDPKVDVQLVSQGKTLAAKTVQTLTPDAVKIASRSQWLIGIVAAVVIVFAIVVFFIIRRRIKNRFESKMAEVVITLVAGTALFLSSAYVIHQVFAAATMYPYTFTRSSEGLYYSRWVDGSDDNGTFVNTPITSQLWYKGDGSVNHGLALQGNFWTSGSTIKSISNDTIEVTFYGDTSDISCGNWAGGYLLTSRINGSSSNLAISNIQIFAPEARTVIQAQDARLGPTDINATLKSGTTGTIQVVFRLTKAGGFGPQDVFSLDSTLYAATDTGINAGRNYSSEDSNQPVDGPNGTTYCGGNNPNIPGCLGRADIPIPGGYFDSSDNSTCTVSGWAKLPATHYPQAGAQQSEVVVYQDGGTPYNGSTPIKRFTATVPQHQGETALDGNYRFAEDLRGSIDNAPHNLNIYAIRGDISSQLVGSSRPMTCSPLVPTPTATPTPPPPPPARGCTADFVGLPTTVTNNQTLTFRAKAVPNNVNPGYNGIYLDGSTSNPIRAVGCSNGYCTWSFNAGSVGNHTVTLSAQDELIDPGWNPGDRVMCTPQGSYTVVYPPIKTSCATVPGSAYTGDTIKFTQSTTGGSGSYNYTWSGAVTAVGGSTVSTSFSTEGTKTENINASSPYGSADASCTIYVAKRPPSPPNNVNIACYYINNGANRVARISWTPGANTPANQRYNIQHNGYFYTTSPFRNSYDITDTYPPGGSARIKENVTLDLSIPNYSLSTVTTKVTSTNCPPPPVISCSASPNPAAIGQNVTFTASSTGGNIGTPTYSWSGAVSGSGSSKTASYSSSGTQTADVIATYPDGTQFNTSCSTVVNPNCNTGPTTCGACSVQCGSGGTQSCTMTTYNGSSTCTQKPGTQTCAPTCGVGSACVVNACIATYTVTGTSYNDFNENAAYDKGAPNNETPYSGATVSITTNSGGSVNDVNGNPVGTRTTNASGQYSFSNLGAGNYIVTLTVPSGYAATTATTRSVSLGPSGTTVNFGIIPICSTGISCGACSVSCGAGTQSCSYTTSPLASPATACRQLAGFTQACNPAPPSCPGVSCTAPPAADTGQNVTFTANPTGGTGTYTYNWSNAVTGTTNPISKTFTTTGTKTARIDVTSAGSASNTCSIQINPAKPGPVTVTTAVTCTPTSGFTGSEYTLSWTNNDVASYTINISTDTRFRDNPYTGGVPFYNKTITGGANAASSTTAPNGFTGWNGASASLTLQPATTYYVTVWNGKHSDVASFTTPPRCPTIPGNCIATPSSADTRQNVTFSASPSGGDGNYAYNWTIDSTNYTSSAVTRFFTSTGRKNASVYVTSLGGRSNTVTCFADIWAAKPGPVTPTTAAACTPATGFTGNNYTLSWTNNDVAVDYVNISEYSDFTTVSRPYYNQRITTTPNAAASVTAPNNFERSNNPNEKLVLKPATIYYVTVWNGKHSDVASFRTPDQCLTASCSGSPANSAYPGDTITWTGTATGGNGTYRYTWSGAASGTTTSPTNTVTATYPTSGSKTAQVDITSGSQTKTNTCPVTINVYATITGTVFEDSESPTPSGSMNGGDPGVSGATVILRNSTNSTEIARTTTNGSNRNNYSFPNVRAGTYYVVQSPPAGSYSTTTAAVPVTVTTGQTQTVNFGIRTTSVTASVLVDMNGNSAPESSEAVYKNLSVVLYSMQPNGSSTVYATQNTDANGNVKFNALPFGNYQVNTSLPSNNQYHYIKGSSGTFVVDQSAPNPDNNLYIQPDAPTINSLSVTNDCQGGCQTSGPRYTSGGTSSTWYNRMFLTLNTTINGTDSTNLNPASAANTATNMYIGFYNQAPGISPYTAPISSSVNSIKTYLNSNPDKGVLLSYNASTQTYRVWEPKLINGACTHRWTDISRSTRSIPYRVTDCSGTDLFQVAPRISPAVTNGVTFWVGFQDAFYNGTMYTSVYATDKTTQEAIDGNIAPTGWPQ